MAEEGKRDWDLKWELLVADAWADADLKKRLMADPMAVLKERGIAPPPGKKVKVIEETEHEFCFVLPPKPSEEELSEEQLETVAGGRGPYCVCRTCRSCHHCRNLCACRNCRNCRVCRAT